MTADNRMGFIREIEDVRLKENIAEFEYASESHIGGELKYANNNIIFRLFSIDQDRNGLQNYVLRLTSSRPREYSEWDEATTDGYYFEGGDSEEIISLFALFFRKRFFRISYTYRAIDGSPVLKDNADFSYIRPDKESDPFLFEPADKNGVDLGDFLDNVRKLKNSLHSTFANSVRLYAMAIREIGTNDELAFIHLVSAIEVLSKDYELLEGDDPVMTHISQINTCFEKSRIPSNVIEDVKNSLNNRKSRLKFTRFIQKYHGGHILERPVDGEIKNKIYLDDLENALKRIYTARSKFLHEGSAMYKSRPRSTINGADYDSSLGQRIDNRIFNTKELLPLISFFEKLVSVCLMNYLKKNQTKV